VHAPPPGVEVWRQWSVARYNLVPRALTYHVSCRDDS
jgi:hypothetical protein